MKSRFRAETRAGSHTAWRPHFPCKAASPSYSWVSMQASPNSLSVNHSKKE